MCLNLGLLCCERAGLGQSHIKETFQAECPGLFPLTSPKPLQAVVMSSQALWHQCQSWEPLTNLLGKNCISLSLWQMSVHSRLPPPSPDIWWPPVYKNSQTFVLPSINRATFIPWNREGTADSIVTKGRKLGERVQTTQQITVCCSPTAGGVGLFPEADDFPFSHLPAQTPGGPGSKPGSRIRLDSSSGFQSPGASSVGRPLRMFTGCSLGHTTLRKSPS